MMIYQNIFHLRTIDGAVYGTSVKRIPALTGMMHGLLISWPRQDHNKYRAQEVRPDIGINVGDYSAESWENCSFVLLYRTEFPTDPYLDEYELPNIDDLSRIEPLPESMRDLDDDLKNMASLLPCDDDSWQELDISDSTTTISSKLPLPGVTEPTQPLAPRSSTCTNEPRLRLSR